MELYFFLILFLLLITFGIAALSFAPWVPIKKKDMARVFKLANLKPGEIFYDLGCGDGRMVIEAAKNYGARAIGLEIAYPMYLICKYKELFCPNAKFKYKNLFWENLKSADVVYFFGFPRNIKDKLRKKLEKELKPGARVISYVFGIEGWQPTAIDRPKKSDLPIYLYIK